MRVRHLQTYLNEQRMLRKSSVDNIRNIALGIDALYFLRNSNEYKDTLCNVAGFISSRFCHYLDEQCARFEKNNISLIFVFEGMTTKAHKLFSSQVQQNIDQGWNHYVNGDKKWALKHFSQVSTHCISDMLYLMFHYLKRKGIKCIYSPYLATAQLAYFYEVGLIDLIFGPPTVLLFDLHIVVVNIMWKKNVIEWLYLPRMLKAWNITKEQFLDACLMAGTEYCLTFPYLNLPHFNGGQVQFNFGTALEFVKQAPLISYLRHFPDEELKEHHINGYCICKSLIKFPVAMLITGRVGFYKKGISSDEINSCDAKKNSLKGNVEGKKDYDLSHKENDREKEKEKEHSPKWSDMNDEYEREQGISVFCEKDRGRKGINEKKNGDSANDETEKRKCEDNPKTKTVGLSTNESGTILKSAKDESGTGGEVANANIKHLLKDGSFVSNTNKEDDLKNKKYSGWNEDKEIDFFKNEGLIKTNNAMIIPSDYVNVVGAKLPSGAYYLMAEGLLSKKILTAIALGEWIDDSHPIIDSCEYRDTLVDLREYRCKILGLIVIKLNPFFHHRKIKFWDTERRVSGLREKNSVFILCDMDLKDGLLWKINKNNVAEEIARQNVKEVDLQFVLKWHVQRHREGVPLIYKYEELDEINRSRDAKDYEETNGKTGKTNDSNSKANNMNNKSSTNTKNNKGTNTEQRERGENSGESGSNYENIKKYNDYYKNILNMNNQSFNSFLTLAYFMFLEKLNIFTKGCGVTLFGLLLSESTSKQMDSTLLVIFELLKLGYLESQPLLPLSGKSYPKNAYTPVMNNKNLSNQDKKSVLLLSRIFSLFDVKLDSQNNYEGLIDFDLCAFFAVVKIIKKTLRQLLQACIANLLLTNMELIEILPPCLFTVLDEHIYGFFSTNYVMGILVKYFLLFTFPDLKNKDKMKTKTKAKAANGNNDESANEGKGNETAEQSGSSGDKVTANEEAEKSCEANQKKRETECTSYEVDNHVDKELEENGKEDAEKKNKDKGNIDANDRNMNNGNMCNSNEKPNATGVEKNGEEQNNIEHNELEEEGDAYWEETNNFEEFEKTLKKNFPSVIDPIKSLCESIYLWKLHLNLIVKLENHTNVYNIVSDLKAANNFLEEKIRYVGLHKTKMYIDICK